jgi:hypothetical protein
MCIVYSERKDIDRCLRRRSRARSEESENRKKWSLNTTICPLFTPPSLMRQLPTDNVCKVPSGARPPSFIEIGRESEARSGRRPVSACRAAGRARADIAASVRVAPSSGWRSVDDAWCGDGLLG